MTEAEGNIPYEHPVDAPSLSELISPWIVRWSQLPEDEGVGTDLPDGRYYNSEQTFSELAAAQEFLAALPNGCQYPVLIHREVVGHR